MSEFAVELAGRIKHAREALRQARAAGEYDAEQVYAGELDSLFRFATENGVAIPPE